MRVLPRSESRNQRRMRVLPRSESRRGSSTPQIADYTDYTDDADYRVCVHPIPIVACWVSLEVFAMAGVGNGYNFLWLLTLGCKPFNPTYGTKLTPMSNPTVPHLIDAPDIVPIKTEKYVPHSVFIQTRKNSR